MKDVATILDRGRTIVAVADVALNHPQLGGDIGKVFARTVREVVEDNDVGMNGDEGTYDVRADETGATSHEDGNAREIGQGRTIMWLLHR